MKLQRGNLIKIGVSLIVLALIVASVGLQNLLAVLSRVNLGWFALALAIHLLGIAIRAYRWGLLIASLGAPVPLGRLFYLYLVGTFFNTLLPTGIGGDVVRVIELAPDRGGATALSTVFADRLTGILGSSLIALAVAAAYPASVPPEVQTLVTAVAAAVLVLALMMTQGRRFDRLIWSARWLSRLPQAARWHRLYTAMTSYSAGAITRSTLVSIPFTVTLIATQYTLSLAIGATVPWQVFVLFTPIVALALLLPISLNGLGIREGAYGLLFAAAGYPAETGVAISLLYFAVRVLTGLAGGVLYILGNLRSPTRRRAADVPTSAPGMNSNSDSSS